MNSTRSILYFLLIIIGFFLWQNWVDFNQKTPVDSKEKIASQSETVANETNLDESIPDAWVPNEVTTNTPESSVKHSSSSQKIIINTAVLELEIDLQGGTVVKALLSDYPVKLKNPNEKIKIFSEEIEDYYVAQSGLISTTSVAPSHKAIYEAKKYSYGLEDFENDKLVVPIYWKDNESGITVEKTFTIYNNQYLIEVHQQVMNHSSEKWEGQQYSQLQHHFLGESTSFSFTNPEKLSFVGSAYYSPEERFQKIDFDSDYVGLNKTISGGWIAMLQHYFFSAWIPEQKGNFTFSTTIAEDDRGNKAYLIRWISPLISVNPGQTETFSAQLYVGPKTQNEIKEIAPGLDLTVDYGIFSVISKPLFWVLNFLYSLFGNWGWAIIGVTFLIKLVFFKLSESQYKSMARMRKVQPRMLALKERYADDRQRLNQAMMELYKKEKVNPLGGCLPLLIQIPVFLALYWVLLESVELRQAPFILWLQDLSSPDPYYILPIIMGAATFAQQRLNPMPSADPIQQKVMMILPFMLTFMFAFFQSGLVLYWTINQLLGLAQQWIITKRVDGGK